MTPYSRSYPPADLLALMEALLTEQATMLLHTESPKRLSYRLREAIHSSRFHEALNKYIILGVWYSFEEHKDWVRARYKGSSQVEKIEVRPTDTRASRKLKKQPDKIGEPLPEPTLTAEELASIGQEVKDALDTCILPNISNLAGVVEGTKRFGNRVLEVFFPEATLSQGDLARLYRWTSEKGWAIIDQEEGGLTLTRKEVDEELTWKPKN